MSDPLPPAAPPLDPRTAEDVRRRVEALLGHYAPLDTTPGAGAAGAIVGVFARFAELIIERLNRAPDKNRLAFFDLVGASPQPPQPARVPLGFDLAVGAREALVPARTPVAAPAGPGRAQPVVYETERELTLTPARLAKVVSWNGPGDASTDCSQVTAGVADPPCVIFGDTTPNPHRLLLGFDDILGYFDIKELLLLVGQLATLPVPAADRTVTWETWDGNTWQPLTPEKNPDGSGPEADSTGNLAGSGSVHFHSLKMLPRSVLGGITSRWIAARLKTPPLPGSEQLGRLSIQAEARVATEQRLPDAVFAGAAPADAASDFLPFGAAPDLGAALYIGCRELLGRPGERIVVSYYPSDAAISGNALQDFYSELTWEFWNGSQWALIGKSSGGFAKTNDGTGKFTDPGSNFCGTTCSETSFILPGTPQPKRMNGVETLWLRVRFSGGRYYHVVPTGDAGTMQVRWRPSLAYLKISSVRDDLDQYATVPDHVFGDDGLYRRTLDPRNLQPFAAAEDAGRSLYLGFEVPTALTAFPQRQVSLYLDLAQPTYGMVPDDAGAASPARLEWSYWDGSAWQGLPVLDQTAGLAYSGIVEFLAPADFAIRRLFDEGPRYWLRVSWAAGDYRYLPRLRRVLQNATMAVQATTVVNEILGSSNGQASQSYTAARKPMLADPVLEVREAELPSAVERAALENEEGPDAITLPADGGWWVRWHAVGDFHASGPRDRHYVIDHLDGKVQFGDGRAGLIPPRGAGNIRLREYRSGGGDAGNAAPGSITQLKTSLPSVASVTQVLPAGGGVAAESLDGVLDRAPRAIRHGQRAVTAQDYEDLARQASTEVARALCVPACDIRDTATPAPIRPGLVSLVIVPHSSDLQPAPGAELIERVRAYLDARRLPGVELIVFGAEYVRVDVEAEIGVTDPAVARAVEGGALSALSAFLHPLTGGHSGAGWDFGRRPHKSDLYALLEGVPGVEYVRRLSITEHVDRPGANGTTRFLVCSGAHRVTLRFGA